VSDALILAQINQINLDFSATNPDISNTPGVFPTGNMNIQFCLATRDPNGNATNGIIRKNTNIDVFDTPNAGDFNIYVDEWGGSDAWPRDKYLNVWVCNIIGGVLGFAPYPGGQAATDGVVIDYATVGSLTNPPLGIGLYGRTLTHEIGHWLNLPHIWGDDGGLCSGSDFVADTPNAAGPNYGCPTFPSISCNNGPNGDMFMNYMDYSNDVCTYMFSPGQVLRSRTLFEPNGARYSLLSSDGCQPPDTTPPPTVTITTPPPTPPPTVTITTPPPTPPPTVTITTPPPTPPPTVTVSTPPPPTPPPTLTSQPTPPPTPNINNTTYTINPNYNRNFDSVNTIQGQISLNYISNPFVISGYTTSLLNELGVYGANKFIDGLIVTLSDGTLGYIVSQSPEYIEYVINGQVYRDYPDGTTIFIVETSGLTENTLTATGITKMEYLMNIIEQPEIQSNVFIERGKYSGLENFRRIGEINNTGALQKYGYKFFDVRNYNNL